MRYIALPVFVAFVLSACGGTGDPGGPAVSAPSERSADGSDGRVAHELLGVQQSAGELGLVEHATDQGRYVELWERLSFDERPPAVDFDEQVVLFYVRAEDGCPDEVGGVRLDGDRLVVDWRPPAGGCIQPLIPTAFALAVHRATVPQRFVVFLEGFHDDHDDVEHIVELAAYEGSGPPDAPARPTPPEPTTVAGTVELPAPGEAADRTLEDGSRVWVVRHRGGGVNVLAADAPAEGDTERLSVRGLRTQVVWHPSARRFGGGGWFDEYGVSLRGRSGTNLDWYETSVDGAEVTVGKRVGSVPYDQPVGDDPPPGDAQPERPDHPRQVTALPLDQARQRPHGSVVVIDAALVAYGDQPLRLCAPPESPELWDWDGCPSDAPIPVGVTLEQADADSMRVWHGPLRATVTADGFSEITLLGAGHSGGRID